jgi:hypothetical protein
VAGEGGLDRHLGGGEVADLAHHDDVRVLAHERPHALGEPQIDLRLHLHLVERGLDHLDRVLDGAHVHLGGGEALQRRVQRGGLARPGGAGDQHDAVGPAAHLVPAALVLLREAELAEVAHQHLGIEDAHHQLLAERRRQGGDAKLDVAGLRRARLDAPVLGPALLDHVHAREDLDAAGHRREHRGRDLVDLVQHAVDAEAHDALVAARLDVDVARALLERVLPQPVDHAHHVRVVGVELPRFPIRGLAELDQLLEVR